MIKVDRDVRAQHARGTADLDRRRKFAPGHQTFQRPFGYGQLLGRPWQGEQFAILGNRGLIWRRRMDGGPRGRESHGDNEFRLTNIACAVTTVAACNAITGGAGGGGSLFRLGGAPLALGKKWPLLIVGQQRRLLLEADSRMRSEPPIWLDQPSHASGRARSSWKAVILSRNRRAPGRRESDGRDGFVVEVIIRPS